MNMHCCFWHWMSSGPLRKHGLWCFPICSGDVASPLPLEPNILQLWHEVTLENQDTWLFISIWVTTCKNPPQCLRVWLFNSTKDCEKLLIICNCILLKAIKKKDISGHPKMPWKLKNFQMICTSFLFMQNQILKKQKSSSMEDKSNFFFTFSYLPHILSFFVSFFLFSFLFCHFFKIEICYTALDSLKLVV